MTVSAPVASQFVLDRPLHPWLKTMRVAYLPGPSTSVAADVAQGIMQHLDALGHVAQERPTDETDVVLTTARFGEARSWRTAPRSSCAASSV